MREQIQTYLIPNNFIDESRVFNGAIRVRYLVEAIIINVRTYQARPVDVMLAETNPGDVLRNSLEKWKNQRSQQNANMDLVENVDFVFMEDKEYEKMTPQEIREKQKQEEKETQRRKKAAKKLKKRKNKETFLLPAGQSDAQSEAENHTAVVPIQKNSQNLSILRVFRLVWKKRRNRNCYRKPQRKRPRSLLFLKTKRLFLN